jgi:hypothetical protein
MDGQEGLGLGLPRRRREVVLKFILLAKGRGPLPWVVVWAAESALPQITRPRDRRSDQDPDETHLLPACISFWLNKGQSNQTIGR